MKIIISQVKKLSRKIKSKSFRTIDRYPMQSFFSLLGIVILLIVISNLLRKPANEVAKANVVPKQVQIYSIGEAPRINLQAKIEKSGVIKLTALSGGVVQKIYKNEGEQVNRGNWIFWLSSNYQGGSIPQATRQIAQTNYQFLVDNYDAQKDIINKSRDIANKVESQAADLRDISAKSIDETKSLISLNENVISMLDSQIQALENLNVNGSSNSAILQLKTGKATALAGLNQAKASERALEYQTGSDNEPAQLATAQKDLTLKQLDLQEKTLNLNKEIALLNLRLAQLQESLLYPAAPFDGVIERIHVKVGQNITPGTILATITGSKNTAKAVVATSSQIANNISQIEPSKLYLNGHSIDIYPQYVSSEPTLGTLNTIIYPIPDEFASQLKNDQILTLEVPLGSINTVSAIPYIPLDSVYQTQDEAFVYVIDRNQKTKTAISKKIKLGQAFGSYVEVTKGLESGDQVIINRNIIEGDSLEFDHQ